MTETASTSPAQTAAAARNGGRKRDPDATRDQLLDAAQEIAAEDGPGTITVSAVARRAGLNRGTAYLHFSNKDELLNALAGRLSDGIHDDLAPIFDLDSINEQIDAFGNFFVDNPELCRVWLYQLLSPEHLGDDSDTRTATENMVTMFGALAKSDKSQDGIDAEALAMIILGGGLLSMVRAHQNATSRGDLEERFDRYLAEMKRLMATGVLRRGLSA